MRKYYVGVLQSEDEIQGSVDAEIWISIDPQICRCRGRKIQRSLRRSEYLQTHGYTDTEICGSMDVQILKSVDPQMYRFYILESEHLRIHACRHLKIRGVMDVEILTSEDLQILWPVNAWIERYDDPMMERYKNPWI